MTYAKFRLLIGQDRPQNIYLFWEKNIDVDIQKYINL